MDTIAVNTFTKGMNKDAHPMGIQEGEYRDARNCTLFSTSNGSIFSLHNEAGFAANIANRQQFQDLVVLGMCNINDDIVVFSIRIEDFNQALATGLITNQAILNPAGQNFISSEVGILERQGEGLFTYRVIINDKNVTYWLNNVVDDTQTLDFDPASQIDCTARVTPDNTRTVYFTDGLNPPRYLRIDIDYANTNRGFTAMADEVRLFDVYDLPIVRYNQTLEGGKLLPGVYQFAVRYLNANLDPTTFGYLCSPIPVVSEYRRDGRFQYDGDSFDSPPVEKTIEVSIHNVDPEYDYIEVAVVYYTGPESSYNIRLIGRFNNTGRTMRVRFDGTFLQNTQALLPETLFREPISYATAKHILQKDDRLFLGNLTEYPIRDLQALANRLLLRFTLREIPYREDTDYFEDYKEENNTFEFKGYRRGEVYSFGIVGVFDDGTKSYVAHIPSNFIGPESLDQYTSTDTYFQPPVVPANYYQDFNRQDLGNTGIRHHRFPTVEEEPHVRVDGNGNLWIRILGLQIVNFSAALDEFPDLRRRLRQIILVREKRDRIQNKSVLTQGCVNPIMKQRGRDQTLLDDPYNGNLPTMDIKLAFGFPDSGIGFLDTAFEAVSVPVNMLLRFLPGPRYRTRITPFNILPSYCIDPLYGNTTVRQDNSVQFINGLFVPRDTLTDLEKSFYAFWSPESTMFREFQIPGNCVIRSVFRANGRFERVVNRRTPENELFLNGSYSTRPYAPYNNTFRGMTALYFTNFDRYRRLQPTEIQAYRVIKTKKTRWNDIAANNGVLDTLDTRIITDPNQRELKLNNYESEGCFILQLTSLTPDDRRTPGIITFPNDLDGILTNIGCDWACRYYPWLPIGLFEAVVKGKESGNDPVSTTLEKIVQVAGTATIGALIWAVYNGKYDVQEDFINGLNPFKRQIDGKNDTTERGNCSRDIYNIEIQNDSQYERLENKPYVPVAILSRLDKAQGDVQMPLYDVDLTAPIYGGDTFITKYFWKSSYNIASKVNVRELSDLNKTALDNMYRTACAAAFLAVPGALMMDYAVSGVVPSTGVVTIGDDTLKLEQARIRERDIQDPYFGIRSGSQLRGSNWVWLESDINSEYRHRPISFVDSAAKSGTNDQFSPVPDPDNARLGVPYYPRDPIDWCLEVTPEFGHSRGYNIQYSFDFLIGQYFSKPFGKVIVTQHPTRIVYSESIDANMATYDYAEPINSQELTDKYRKFLPNSYQDFPKNKGEITNMFEYAGKFYAQAERSTFLGYVNTRVPLGQGEDISQLYLGTGGVFTSPPLEVYPINGGYAGNIHKWAGVNTPFGYFFVDALQKKVFILRDGLEEISQAGMQTFFLNNTNVVDNNPANPVGRGYVALYDGEHRRVILGMKNGTDVIDVPDGGNPVLTGEYNTLSFSFMNNKWVSFHDYIPAIGVNSDLHLVSTRNILQRNTTYLHNRPTRLGTGQLDGRYGVFYENVQPEVMRITIIVNDNPAVSKVFDNQMVLSQIIDEASQNGIVQYRDFFTTIQCWNDYQGCNPRVLRIYPFDGDTLMTNTKLYNNQYQVKLPLSESVLPGSQRIVNRFNPLDPTIPVNNQPNLENKPRFRSKYLIVEYVYDNRPAALRGTPYAQGERNFDLSVQSIMTKYRISQR